MSTFKEQEIAIRQQRIEISKIEALIVSIFLRREETWRARAAVQLAFMWLGKALEVLGSDNPYPNSTNPENKIIEPTADQAQAVEREFEGEIHFAKSIRADIDPIIKTLAGNRRVLTTNPEYQDAVNRAYGYLVEGKMWLGQTLRAIRTDEIRAGEMAEKKAKQDEEYRLKQNHDADNQPLQTEGPLDKEMGRDANMKVNDEKEEGHEVDLGADASLGKVPVEEHETNANRPGEQEEPAPTKLQEEPAKSLPEKKATEKVKAKPSKPQSSAKSKGSGNAKNS